MCQECDGDRSFPVRFFEGTSMRDIFLCDKCFKEFRKRNRREIRSRRMSIEIAYQKLYVRSVSSPTAGDP